MNRYDSPVQNSLESYVPIPLDAIAKTGAAIQDRYNTDQAADAAANSSLSNVRTTDPLQAQLVTKLANQYKEDSGALIDKYQNRYDDPGYKREQQQMILKYSSNPAYGAISRTNAFNDNQTKLQQKEEADGHEMYGSNPNFKGVDDNGNVVVPTEGYKRFTYATTLDARSKEIMANTDANKTESNISNLQNYLSKMLVDPEIRKQAVLHQNRNGIFGNAAEKGASQEISNIVMTRGYTKEDPSYGLEKIKAEKAATKEKNSFMPTASMFGTPQFNIGAEYNPDKWWSGTGTHNTSFGSAGESSLDENRIIKDKTFSHRTYLIGKDNPSNLSSTLSGYTMENGVQGRDQLMAVMRDTGELAAINQDSHGVDASANTASEKFWKDPVSGTYYVNHGLNKSKPMGDAIQFVAMKTYKDNKNGNVVFEPMSAHDSRIRLGGNYSTEVPKDYTEAIQHVGKDKFINDLSALGYSKDRIAYFMKAKGAEKENMNRELDNLLMQIPTDQERNAVYGNQGKSKALADLDYKQDSISDKTLANTPTE